MQRLNQKYSSGASVIVAIFFLAISTATSYAENSSVSRLALTASGTAISIFITLTIVQRAIKEDRNRQWQGVKLRTYLVILGHLSNIALSFHLYHTQFRGTKDSDNCIDILRRSTYDPKEEVSKAMMDFADIAKAKHSPEESFDKKVTTRLVMFYDSMNMLVNDLNLILIPRVLQLSDNDEMHKTLSDLEYLSSNLQRKGFLLKNLWDKYGAISEF